MKVITALIAVAILFPASSFGFGNAGHEIVGNLAEHHLKGTRAAKNVAALLRPPKENLAKASTWPDRAKLPEKYLTPEMAEFVANNPDHHKFHYCDVPFQEKSYRLGGTGTNPADIVQTMKLCIAVLRDPNPAPPNPRKFTKRVALFVLAHLVGDIHQPLHVGCSYVDENNKFVNPDRGEKGQEDAGANYFKLTGSIALHGYWDTVAVKKARDKAAGQDYVSYLLTRQPPRPGWQSKGPVATWPEQWADDALRFSPECFKGITLSDRRTVPADEKHPAHDEWKVTLPPDYEQRAANIVEVQLAKAGYRLAELLKAIWP